MEHNEEEKIKKEKRRQKKEKQKRDFKILMGLAIIALLFIIISLAVIFKSENKEVVNPNNDEVQIDTESPAAEEDDDQPVTDDKVGDEVDTDDNAETDKNKDETKSEEEELKTPVSSYVYANNKMRITYSIPDSWEDKIQIYEDKTTMEFFYKEENLFLTVKTVTQGEYDDYYSGVYNIATKKGGILVIYLLPNEHPLARVQGSEDYQELTAIMSDNYNFIKTIKIN